MAKQVAFLSFRFGATDGVSVVARSWMRAMEATGARVLTVTGEPTVATPYANRVVDGLGLNDRLPAEQIEGPLHRALEDIDLVVVENLLTIPINLEASHAVETVLTGRPSILHHHDPPWQRARYEHVTSLPAVDPAWRHVAITRMLAGQLAERGIRSTVIHNAFIPPPERSPEERQKIRDHVRSHIGFDSTERVIAHPVRAIARKNIPAAIALAEALDATYWLLGPAEEGYGEELSHHLDSARCRVVHKGWSDPEGIYLAADHITFPSTWEGFGNPPIEAALHRRTVSVGDYPVADELRGYGFHWYRPDRPGTIASLLDDPDSAELIAQLRHDENVARREFSTEKMARCLTDLLDEAGWSL